MRRPLMAVCLCLVLAAAMFFPGKGPGGWAWLKSTGRDSSRTQSPSWEELSSREGTEMTVTGRVYRKEDNNFYLDSIKILKTAAGLQQDIPITYNFIVTKAEEEDVPLGCIVTVTGTFWFFSEATNPGEFDAAKYYRTLGVVGRLSEGRILNRTEECWMVRETLYRLKIYWKNRLYRVFPEKEASVMSAMLLGEKTGLDREIKALYQRNGIVHILSISGLHITIIGMGIYRMLRRLGVPVWLAALAGGGILILYGVMTGLGVSSCRAIGMYLIRMLGEMTGRTYDMMTAWGVTAAVMVIKNPLYLRHSGFLLSYTSILGIGALYPLLYREGGKNPGRRLAHIGWKVFLGNAAASIWNRLKQSMLAGFSITAMTLPIQLWFYYEVPVYSILINLLILPFMSLVMVTGLIAMLVPGFGILGTAAYMILQGYESLCRFFDGLPGHTWNPGCPEIWQILLYYVVLFSVMGVLKGCQDREGLRCREQKRRRQGRESRIVWDQSRHIRALAIVLLTISVILLGKGFRQGNSVTILDVGQGDCICLQTEGGQVYLFDCGSSSREQVGMYVLKPFLKYCGISHVDGIFVSHPDADHCNGIGELLRNGKEWGITVGTLVLSEGSRKALADGHAEEYGELMASMKEGGCTAGILGICAGDRWEAEGISFICLHPEADDEEGANASSQCFYVDLGGYSLLLTGDVEKDGEKQLLERLKQYGIGKVTVLKVAHHGSRNSTSAKLLAQIQPKAAVISCSENNRYGHPHEELLERLEDADIKVLCTDELGAVEIKTKGAYTRIAGYGSSVKEILYCPP